MEKLVATFTIAYHQLLDSNCSLIDVLPDYLQDKEHIISLYKIMALTRIFDYKAVALQRTGKLGTYPSNLGHEAIGVGVASAMAATDVLCPYYRDFAAQFWRGVTMEETLLFWGGNEEGSNYRNYPAKIDLPIAVPIGSQTLYAAGIAKAIKIKKEPRAVVVTIGDGGTSRGDFYEAINVAGVWELPIVFVINNNQWSISVPRLAQSKAITLAQKGIAGGVKSLQVDGNDIFAVRAVMSEALSLARNNGGPTVVEAITYRLADHTTADDARRYRTTEELAHHQTLEPLLRFKKYLLANNILSSADLDSIDKDCNDQVAKAVVNYFNYPQPSISAMFDYLYQDLPEYLQWQKQDALNKTDSKLLSEVVHG